MSRPNPATSPALDPETLDPSLELGLPDRAPSASPPSRPLGITPDGRLKAGRLAGLSMRRAIAVLAWPIFVQAFLQALVGLTDTFLAANISEDATDAIGGAAYIIWLVGVVVMAIGVGATAVISRSVGGRRLAVANAALGQAIILAIVGGGIMGIVVALGAGPASHLMSLSDNAADGFRRFLLINALSAPLIALLSTGIECARAAGDSYRPLKSMVVVNIVNMLASWLLSGVDLSTTALVEGHLVRRTILANPSPLHLGVTGIALGTLTAQAVGTLVILRLLVRGTAGLRLRRRRLRPHWHTMRRLLRVGLPNFLETFGMWFGNMPIILMVGWLARSAAQSAHSAGLLGAHIIAIRIESFSFLPGFAMGAAAATLAGQYLGAGSPALAKRSMLICTGIAAVFMGAVGLAFILIPEPIVRLLTSQPSHLELVPRLLRITGTAQVPFAISIVFRAGMRGAGDVKIVMILTWLTTYAIRLPIAYALCGADIPLPGGTTIYNPFRSPEHGGLPALWIGLCIEVGIRAAAFTARFVHGGWSRLRV